MVQFPFLIAVDQPCPAMNYIKCLIMFVIFRLKFVEMPVKGVPKNAVLLAAKVTTL